MDAPPTQYRVIERGRKLIVLETRTNRPPKQASDMQPGRQGSRTARPMAPTPAPTHSDRPRLQDESRSSADAFEELFDGAFKKKNGAEGPSAGQIGFGAVIFGIAVGAMIGGFTGFLFTAAIIIIAGNVAFRRLTKRR